MKQSNLRANIRHLCCLGLPSETLMPRLLPLVRELVPADSAGFFWVDGTGHMQNMVAERMLTVPKLQLYFDHFYTGGKYDFRENFLARAAAEKSVAVAEPDAAFRESAYYQEILKDLDAHHMLYGIARDHGVALGQLSLYRNKQQANFSEQDQEALASVMHYVTHAVAAPAPAKIDSAHAFIDTADDAVLMVNRDGSIVHASDQGRRLALQAAGGNFAHNAASGENDNVRKVLTEAIGMLEHEQVPLLSRTTHWGRVQLRAYALSDDRNAPVAVRIIRQEPMILKFARALQNVDLPPRQQEIAMQLARGASNADIAKHMGISSNTVAYHIKQLFARLEAHGRAELIEKVIGGR